MTGLERLDAELAAIVERPLVGVLGTISPGGVPHLTVVWFVARDGELLIATPGSSRKAKNVLERPIAELCVNAGAVGPCATVRGEARLAGPASSDFVAELARRYLGEVEGARYMQIRDANSDSVVISIKPTSWRIWDVDEELAES